MSMTGPDPEHPTKVGVPIGDLLDEIEDACAAEDAGVPAAWLDAVDQAQRADGSSP